MGRRLLLPSLIALVVLALWLLSGPPPVRGTRLAYPWQVDLLPGGGSRVLGLVLGVDTLHQATAVLGTDVQLALFGGRDTAPVLEAYFARVQTGALIGKVVLTLEQDSQELQRLFERAPEAQLLPSGARKVVLGPSQVDRLGAAVVVALTYLPTVNLSTETILKRFGEPAARVPAGQGSVHWQYPDKGLDVTVNTDGKEILQFVAPAQFNRRLGGPVKNDVRPRPGA
jgi:hypothetical protein